MNGQEAQKIVSATNDKLYTDIKVGIAILLGAPIKKPTLWQRITRFFR